MLQVSRQQVVPQWCRTQGHRRAGEATIAWRLCSPAGAARPWAVPMVWADIEPVTNDELALQVHCALHGREAQP